MAINAFERAMPLINARFQEYGRAATPEDIAGLRSQAESLGLDFSDPNLGFTPQYQSWATAVANAAKPAPVASPLSYLQVGQQLFNRELAQPEINYLQSLYGQDVDPTEMTALQAALNPNQNIQNLYQSVLGRQADPFGGMYWANVFGSEISPEEEAAFRQAAAPEIAARPTGALSSIAAGNDSVSTLGATGNDSITGALNNITSSAAGNDSVSAAANVDFSDKFDNSVASSAARDTSSRFYDPVLKTTWEIESALDFGLANNPRFKGQDNLVYIDPSNGSELSRVEYLQVANTPEAVSYRAEQARLAAERAKLFRPGNTLTSGFGNVIEQLGGSGYYKGVAIPQFRETYESGEAGAVYTVADQLATWKANIDKQDLSANAPFGFVETLLYETNPGDYDPYIIGYETKPATAFDYLIKNNPAIANAILGHTSTFANAYKIVNGQLKEVGHSEITPEDIAQGNAFFMLGGATGGPNRQRMAQLYRTQGNDLIPVGDPKIYQGAKEQNMGLAFLDMAASALSIVPGPWQIPAAVYTVARAADAGDWTQAALAAIPIVGDIANAAAIASEAAQIAGAVDSASFANDIVNAVSSAVPSLDSVGKVTNALQQSVSALRAIDDKNWLGLVSSGAGLAGVTGTIDAKTAGLIRSTANLASVLNSNGSPAQIIAAATTLANNQDFVDRATTDQVNAVASLIAAKDNPSALMAAAAQVARSGVFNETARIGAQYEKLSSSGAIDEYNVTGGGGALTSSGNPAEDEQIAIQQRITRANQAIADYAGPGNDLSREGLVSQLQSFGLTADQAEDYARQADQRINMNRVGADVMSRYSKIDPEFGTPQLDRNTAVQEMVAAGFTSDRANEILNGIDAQNAIKLENKLSVQSAYNNFLSGKADDDALISAMISAGYSDSEIADLVTRGNAVIAGRQLTSGEQVKEDVAALPDIRAQIAEKPTFNEAYALARERLGAGATFTWQGKSYSTATAEERPDLSAAGLAAKALSGDPQFQIALSENAVQNQRNISQVFADYSQKGGDLTREGALSRLEKLGVTKDQASFYLDQADGKLPLLFDQFKSKVPTASEDSYRAYILAFNELKNKGVPTSLIDVSGYAASGAKPNYPTFINAISLGFGMGAEAAGNTLKAFGTIGESLGFNTAQMSDLGRRLENIAQELYPQALITSEDEVKARFANAKTGTDLLNAIKDSFVNNPGAVAKMIGVEGIQELPNIALALATGGASAVIRYGGMLAGLGLDIVESAGLQGAQKIEEGLANGLSRADAVKGAVNDMKKAGTVTAIMTAAADKVPFGGTIAKTAIKGSAGEGIEEYVTARWTGASHFDALRQAAFGAMIGGPTEASLQGAGNLTSVVTQGDKMIGTYEDGTKVTISEGAKDLIVNISRPSTLSSDVSLNLTSSLNAGTSLSTAINDVVVGSTDLSAAVDGTINGLLTSNADLSTGVTDLTLAASNVTGNTNAAIDQVVAGLAGNNVDLNANAGSVVVGAINSGADVAAAVDATLRAVTANGGSVADSASSIVAAVGSQGDTTKVAGATAAVVDAAITSGTNITSTTVAAVDSALQVTGGNAAIQVVGDISKLGNNDATAAAIVTAVSGGADVSGIVDAAIKNGADTKLVVSSTIEASIKTSNDTTKKTNIKSVGDTLLAQGMSMEQIAATLSDQLAGTNLAVSFTMVDGKPTTNIVEVKTAPRSITGTDYSAYSDLFAGKFDASARSDLTAVSTNPALAEAKASIEAAKARAAANTAKAEEQTRTFNGTVYPTVEARNAAFDSYIESIGQKTLGATPTTSSQAGTDISNQAANLASVVNFLGQMGITPTNSMVADLMASNATNAQVLQNIRSNAEVRAALDAGSKVDVRADAKALGDTLISQGASLEQVSQALNNQLQGTNFRASFTVVDGKPTTNIVEVKEVPRSDTKDYSAYSNLFADAGIGTLGASLTGKFDAARAATDATTRTFNGTVYPTVEARNEAMNAFYGSTDQTTSGATSGTTSKPAVDTNNQTANLSDVISLLSKMGITPTNSMVADLTANNATNAQVIQNLQNNAEIKAIMDVRVASQANAAVDNTVSAAITSGASVDTTVTAAIDGASNANSNVVAAVDTSVASAVTVTAVTGGDVASSVTLAVNGAINSTVGSQVTSTTVVSTAIDAAVGTSISLGSDPAVVINAAVDGAVNNNVDLSTATAAAVSSAVVAGTDASVASTAVNNTNVITDVTVNNGITTVTSSTNDTSTSIQVGDDTKLVTVITNDKVVVTETDLTNNVTTQTTTTTTGTNTNTFVHVVPPPLDAAGTPTGTSTGTPTGTSTASVVPTGGVIDAPVTSVSAEPPQVTLAAEPAKTEEKKTTKPSASPAAAASGLITSAARLPTQTWLDPTILKASGPERQYEDPLAKLRRIEEQWEPQTMINQPEPTFEEETPYYAYGQEDSIDDILAMLKTPEEEEPTYRQGGMVLPLLQAKGGHIEPTMLESRAVDRKYQSPLQQYKGRENFKEGKHVAGPGDGQSDDIPAWLADGEFVFPADVVSALGNGSTKAGTEKLYQMMHSIRQRARSKGPKDLPPPALKSPLDYLKSRR